MKKIELLEEYLENLPSEGNFEDELFLNLKNAMIEKNSIFEDFTKNNLKAGDQKLLTASFAKIILNYSSDQIGTILYHKIIKYFDNSLKWLYKKSNLKNSRQTYEKINCISEAIRKNEIKLDELLSNFTELKSTNSFRQQFMRLTNQNEFKYFLAPFFPPSALDKLKLDTIFKEITSFNEEQIKARKRAFYIQLKSNLEKYIQNAEEYRLCYSEKYAIRLGSGILKLVKDNMFNEGAGSANVSLSPVVKKYPLHKIDKFNLLVRLSNQGPGMAENVEIKFPSNENFKFIKSEFHFQTLDTKNIDIEVVVNLLNPIKKGDVLFELNWNNFDGTVNQQTGSFELVPQRTDINWEDLKKQELYSILPVEHKEKLIGRTNLLDDLISKAKSKNVGSCFLFGQKRVGKTSIVKTFKNCFEKIDNYVVVYLDGTTIRELDALATINTLGRRLCRNLKKTKGAFKNLTIPKFQGSLTPLLEFIEDIWDINQQYRIILVIDEFDEFPIESYRRGPIGDTLFSNLRGLTNEHNIGFILVGSENIPKIISMQGYRENNWDVEQVDAFDFNSEYSSYADLVRKPLENFFEFSDDAIEFIYKMSNGNPYFTNIICREIFRLACDNKDASISQLEAELGVEKAIEKAKENLFQHYWEDGILENYEKKEEISITRRRLLIAIAEILRRKSDSNYFSIEEVIKTFIPSELNKNEEKTTICQREIRDFLNRKILKKDNNGKYHFTTKLFEKWLINKGVSEIIIKFQDIDNVLERMREDEKYFVQPQEIDKAIKNILFLGKKTKSSQVRDWLEQFGDNESQREIFNLLKNVTHYNYDYLNKFVRECHAKIHRDLDLMIKVRQQSEGEKIDRRLKREDILIIFLNNEDKALADIYAEKNKVYTNLIKSPNNLDSVNFENINSIIIITDILDHADSVITKCKKIYSEIEGKLQKDVKINLISIAGLINITRQIKSNFETINLPVQIFASDSFEDDEINLKSLSNNEKLLSIINRAFKPNRVTHSSNSFNILFDHNCPQSSLPIYWYPHDGWISLFKNDGDIDDKFSNNEQYRSACYEIGEELERKILDLVQNVLMDKYDSPNNKWWLECIPDEVRKKCAHRREDEKHEDDLWNYLDLLDYPKIVQKNDELKPFFYFDINEPGRPWNSIAGSKRTKWIIDFNNIRKKYAHPSRKPPTLTHFQKLKKIYDKFFQNLEMLKSNVNS